MSRLLKITYAGLTIGKDQADASYNLTDKIKLGSSYPEFSISFDVVVSNATRSSFLSAEAALIAAYRKPDQALTVVLGSTDRYDYDPSDNTGFNARATCAKVGGLEDTANSARYRCSVTVQLPANLSGRDGRQSSTVTVDANPSEKRTVTIEGAYTALSSNSASAQYASAVETYCSGVLTAVGGTYNLLPHTYAYDDQNKVLSFKRVYKEVDFAESLSGTDDAAICDQQFVIDRAELPADGDWDKDVQPLQRLTVAYSCWVKKSQTTDLKTLYEATIRPHILAQVQAVTTGTVVVVNERPSFDLAEHRIACAMELAASVGGQFIQADIEVSDEQSLGVVLVPVWDGLPFSRDRYDVPQTHVKTIDRVVTWIGEPGTSTTPAVNRFVLVGRGTRVRRTRVGRPSDFIKLTSVREVFRFEKADVQQVGAAGGGTRVADSEDGRGLSGVSQL